MANIELSSFDDEELWALAHKVAGSSSKYFDASEVATPLGVALTVELAQGIIDNGGIEFLLGPDLPDGVEYNDIVHAFKTIDSWLCAEALDAVIKVFPGGNPPKSIDERKASFEKLSATHRDLFDQASRAFWDKSEMNYAAALKLLRSHPEVLEQR